VRVVADGGVALEVAVEGPVGGPPVLLIHGWPDSHVLWRDQVRRLTAEGYRTIAPDLRGFGGSDMPADVDSYQVGHSVMDMVAVLDACGVARANVVCHDWGAAVGWGLAGFLPDRVERLVALSVGHPASFTAAGFEQRMRSLYMLLFSLPVIAEQWFASFGRQFLASHPDLDEVMAELDRPGRLTASLNWYRANASAKTLMSPPPEVPPALCPVMGIWSSTDPVLTELQMTGSSRHVQGGWRYVRIEGASHWMQRDAAEEVNALLLDFLG
jgi:pimeloyl-ACP methyl ester carboxylesterase